LDSQDAEPTINFEEKSVIGIHLGQKPSSGYRVQVTRIEDKDSHLVVNYDVVSPSKNCNVDTALTYPYCFVAIAKNSKPVEYKARNIKRCGV
jgi:hypothetical protein